MTAKIITMFTVAISSSILEKLMETNGKSNMARWIDYTGTGALIITGLSITKDVIDILRGF